MSTAPVLLDTAISEAELIQGLASAQPPMVIADVVHHQGGVGTSRIERWVACPGVCVWRVLLIQKDDVDGGRPHRIGYGVARSLDAAVASGRKTASRLARQRRLDKTTARVLLDLG